MSAPLLSEFTASLRLKNVSKPTHYYVQIIPPKAFEKDARMVFDNKLVSMWCSQAMTPQTTINTDDDFLEHGTRRKFAFDQDYQNLTLHFYLDQDFDIQKFFDMWKYSVVPQRRNFNYYDDYVADVLNLFIINEAGQETYKYEYSKIYPKSINAVELSYTNGASISTFSVDFAFEEVYFTSMADKFTSKPNVVATTKPPRPKNPEVAQEVSPQFDNPMGDTINS